jgi:hypothetical protein
MLRNVLLQARHIQTPIRFQTRTLQKKVFAVAQHDEDRPKPLAERNEQMREKRTQKETKNRENVQK